MHRSRRKTSGTLGKLASQTHAGGLHMPDNDPIIRGAHIQDAPQRQKIDVQIGGLSYSAPAGTTVKLLTSKTDVRIIPRTTLQSRVFSGSQSYLDVELDKIPVAFSDHAVARITLRNSGAADFTLASIPALFERIELRPAHQDPQVTYYSEDIFEALYAYCEDSIRANCEETGMFSPTEYPLGRAYQPNNKDRVVAGDGIPGAGFSLLGNLTGAILAPDNLTVGATTKRTTLSSYLDPANLVVKAGSTKVLYLPLDFLFYFHKGVHIPTLCASNRPIIRFYFASDDTIIGNDYNFSAGRDDVSDDPTVLFPNGTRGRAMINARIANELTLDDFEIKIQGTYYTNSEHDMNIARVCSRMAIKTCLPQRFICNFIKASTGVPTADNVTLTGLVGSTAGLTAYFKKKRDVGKAGANRHFVSFIDSTWRTSGGRVIDEDRKTNEIHSRIPERVAFHKTSELNPFIKGHSSKSQYYFERPDHFSYTLQQNIAGAGVAINTGLGAPRGLLSSDPYHTGVPDESPRIYAEFYCRDIIGDIHKSTETGTVNYDGNYTWTVTFGNDFYDRSFVNEDILAVINQQRNSSIYITSGDVQIIRH